MPLIRDKLEQLREVVGNHSPEAIACLWPGMQRSTAEEVLSRLPFRVSSEAAELFAWCDGSIDGQFEFLPGAYFLPLGHSYSAFEQLLPYQQEFEEVFPQKYRASFCFLADKSDGGYAFGAVDGPAEGAIVKLEIHDEWTLGFSSLELMIDTAIACWENGVFADPAMSDFDRYYELARSINKGMSAWSFDQ